MSRIADKVIVITGASSGIAEAIAYAIGQPDTVDISELVVRPTSSAY